MTNKISAQIDAFIKAVDMNSTSEKYLLERIKISKSIIATLKEHSTLLLVEGENLQKRLIGLIADIEGTIVTNERNKRLEDVYNKIDTFINWKF